MSAATIPTVHLKPGREKSLRRRHPWVFSGAVARIDGAPGLGATVRVVSHAGEFLAHASYSPESQIRVRVWSFNETTRIDSALIARRIEQAVASRRAAGLLERNGACRLVFSEADWLPGLIVDRYGDFVVCQLLAAGAEHWRSAIVDALARTLSPRGIFERSEASMRRKEGLASSRGPLLGDPPPRRVEIEDHGLRQLVDIEHGQKTGAYLDQQFNRRRVTRYADRARVLDAYAYSGGFGLGSIKAGATSATFIDSSATALETVAAAADLNGLGDRCRIVEADVAAELRGLDARGERFDLIVLDPPKFVHTAQQINSGCRAYKDINRLALQLLEPGGVLASFSCSSHVDAGLLQKVIASAALEAGREAQIVERLGQPVDHPVALHFPEGEYLKGFVIRAAG